MTGPLIPLASNELLCAPDVFDDVDCLARLWTKLVKFRFS